MGSRSAAWSTGCPPLIGLSNEDIQPISIAAAPGQSRFTTQRQEPDAVKILSGVCGASQTGVQVTTARRSLADRKHRSALEGLFDIKDKFRPGHADFTYEAKYGLRDYRGADAPRRARPRTRSRPARSRARFC